MTSWSHGYNVSAGYTFGFYRELAPDWIDLALALRGLETPRRTAGAPFRYLELGSGQGVGLCLLAAANPEGEFLGVDFSPEHTAHAAALAAELNLSNVSFVEGDFAALGAEWPASFGLFDYVSMHGIYSWVPAAIRRSLIALLSAATSPGAAVYVSFNAMPGWTSTLPFQHMLHLLHTDTAAKDMAAIKAGRELFEQLEAAGSGVTQLLPALKTRLENTRKQPEPYLVQEYLHENWHPHWCSKVMVEMAGAKLTLASTATLAEILLPHVLPKPMQDVLAARDQPRLREDLTDCLINQTFRRDLYLRGVRRRNAAASDWAEGYRFWRLNPASPAEEISITTSYGGVKLKAASVAPILEALGEGSRSLAELAALPVARKDPQAFQQRLVLLLHAGWLGCSRRGEVGSTTAAAANVRLAALAAEGAPYRHLAAANLGSGIGATEFELLMLDAHAQNGDRFEKEGATILQAALQRLGRRFAKDGKPLPADEERTQSEAAVKLFTTVTLPRWRALGVIS